MMGYGYGMMVFAMIIPLLLIGLVVYAAVKLALGSNRSNNTLDVKNDAIDILNERYSKGEISEEEYTRKKKMIRE
ncbi:SHOCT domain-containing protein [Lutispora saccharofermentans]|uniref:SHOCT domain-containing protein n=1 Tax=Lutispora saccharofermentans TaxID=3024236 RepID=A0ABT1NIM5_9FIRM|nr:SHOCT domain-containing protein [Lutispora saccharofermentans]MCQ1531089.1 SHOCT domain-containing protein [Lutispora saccharofermentans]